MKRTGFTLVEIMVVVVIIGLLLAIALPAFAKVRSSSQQSRFINDLRVFQGALSVFVLENGIYPNDSGTGQLDNQMEDYIRRDIFEAPTPVGGEWDIEAGDGGTVMLGVGVDGHDLTNDELLAMDARYDDGDLSTGKLQAIEADRYYWVLEE